VSTPSIAAPRPLPRALGGASTGRGGTWLRRLVRGREDDPAWSRPLLWLIALLAGVLTLWGLTRNGYANTYYAEAAQAASRGWKAWFTNALDVSGYDSLDKGPLSNMLMGLSGRLFGFSSSSMLVPEALCGVGSVLVLHNLLRRSLGHRAAILAALMLALTPIFIAIGRFNNPDALLVLIEVAAAWALVRALESGRTRHVLLCGLFVGLAFNVKMLQAYLVVPALALTFLIAGRGRIRRRVAQLAAGGGVMLAVSFAWYGTMMLLPAGQRPWVGDTTDNSWFTLIFGANGVSRVSGTAGGPGGGFGGNAGPLRLFNTAIGGQIAWLLPLAVCGLALGLWSLRRSPRTDPARAAYLLWGVWAVVSWAVFSFSTGIFHPYYTTALAPAVAVLAAGGLVMLWDRSRQSAAWSAALAGSVIGTAVLAAILLARSSGFVPWLAPLALALAVIAAAAVMLRHLVALHRLLPVGATLTRVALLTGLLAVLAGPASYSIATVGRSLSGTNPLGGPASAGETATAPPGAGAPISTQDALGAFALPGDRGVQVASRLPTRSARLSALPGAFRPTRRRSGTPGGGIATGAGKAVVSYLEAHQGSTRYLVAAEGSGSAASLALASGRNVIDMGGFSGSDPSPSLSALQGLIGSGQLHYVLLGRGGGGGKGGQSSATHSRDSWIKSHGKLVKLAGATSRDTTLYYLTSSS
jgi:4-amino-4-deoxy-L-arabinose transferase-like glycosyltransferase